MIYNGRETAYAQYRERISSKAVVANLPLWKGWQHFLYLLPVPQGQG